MGWWKMAIFHFKHSYLNWRAIPCKRRNDLRFCGFFIIFSTFFFLDSLNFRLDSTRIFQVHDMTIIFFFLRFFILTICLLRKTMHTIDGLPSWSISSHVRICFERVGLLVQSCLGHFCPKRGSWLKSISKKWAILVNMPQGINQGDFRISRS